MTRTEKLGLCTWVETDPVSLTEMNENFTKLDTSGAQAISRAEAAGINIAGLLLHSHHAGKDISFAQDAAVGDFTRPADAQQYAQLYFSSEGARLLDAGYAGETKSTGTIVISSALSPVRFLTLQPSGYAQLSSIKIDTSNSIGVELTDQVLVYCNGTLEFSSDEYHKTDTTSQMSFTYTFHNEILDPNKAYEFFLSTDFYNGRTLKSATISASPVVYTAGWLISQPVQLPTGCERAVVHIYASGTPFTLEYRLNGGAWNDAAPSQEKQATSQTGAACTLSRFDLTLAGAQTLELRMSLPAADSVVYGYSGAIL